MREPGLEPQGARRVEVGPDQVLERRAMVGVGHGAAEEASVVVREVVGVAGLVEVFVFLGRGGRSGG